MTYKIRSAWALVIISCINTLRGQNQKSLSQHQFQLSIVEHSSCCVNRFTTCSSTLPCCFIYEARFPPEQNSKTKNTQPSTWITSIRWIIFGCLTLDKKLSSQSKQSLRFLLSFERKTCFRITSSLLVVCSAFQILIEILQRLFLSTNICRP